MTFHLVPSFIDQKSKTCNFKMESRKMLGFLGQLCVGGRPACFMIGGVSLFVCGWLADWLALLALPRLLCLPAWPENPLSSLLFNFRSRNILLGLHVNCGALEKCIENCSDGGKIKSAVQVPENYET